MTVTVIPQPPTPAATDIQSIMNALFTAVGTYMMQTLTGYGAATGAEISTAQAAVIAAIGSIPAVDLAPVLSAINAIPRTDVATALGNYGTAKASDVTGAQAALAAAIAAIPQVNLAPLAAAVAALPTTDAGAALLTYGTAKASDVTAAIAAIESTLEANASSVANAATAAVEAALTAAVATLLNALTNDTSPLATSAALSAVQTALLNSLTSATNPLATSAALSAAQTAVLNSLTSTTAPLATSAGLSAAVTTLLNSLTADTSPLATATALAAVKAELDAVAANTDVKTSSRATPADVATQLGTYGAAKTSDVVGNTTTVTGAITTAQNTVNAHTDAAVAPLAKTSDVTSNTSTVTNAITTAQNNIIAAFPFSGMTFQYTSPAGTVPSGYSRSTGYLLNNVSMNQNRFGLTNSPFSGNPVYSPANQGQQIFVSYSTTGTIWDFNLATTSTLAQYPTASVVAQGLCASATYLYSFGYASANNVLTATARRCGLGTGGTWSTITAYPASVYGMAATELGNGTVLCVGGTTSAASPTAANLTTAVYMYNETANTYTALSNAPFRSGQPSYGSGPQCSTVVMSNGNVAHIFAASSVSLDGSTYQAAGYTSICNPTTGAWTAMDACPIFGRICQLNSGYLMVHNGTAAYIGNPSAASGSQWTVMTLTAPAMTSPSYYYFGGQTVLYAGEFLPLMNQQNSMSMVFDTKNAQINAGTTFGITKN